MRKEAIKLVFEDLRRLKIDLKALYDERNKSGVICPRCGGENDNVTNSRMKDGTRTRTRECRKCGEVWKTVEVLK